MKYNITHDDPRAHILDLPTLAPDDTFDFKCLECGKCCRNRDDILLTPLDLYKMSKHLKMTIFDFFNMYCESYLGSSSRLPVVRLRPREYRNSCPLNSKGLCIVHSVKPVVCALYPLGRYTSPDAKGFQYIFQNPPCGSRSEKHTVKEWLAAFNIEAEESLSRTWHEKLSIFSDKSKEIIDSGQLSKDGLDEYISLLFIKMYIDYDVEQDYLPQLEENFELISMITHRYGG